MLGSNPKIIGGFFLLLTMVCLPNVGAGSTQSPPKWGVKKTKPNIGFNPDHVDGGGVKTRQLGYPNRGTAVGTY